MARSRVAAALGQNGHDIVAKAVRPRLRRNLHGDRNCRRLAGGADRHSRSAGFEWLHPAQQIDFRDGLIRNRPRGLRTQVNGQSVRSPRSDEDRVRLSPMSQLDDRRLNMQVANDHKRLVSQRFWHACDQR